MNADTEFRPSGWIRHHQLQSILATKGPRRKLWLKRGSQMEAVQQWQVLDAGNGVRLCGMHSRQPANTEPRGLCVLIHGWEGSHESVYLYSMACALYAAGYNVFRLNLRDHGGSHALNQEMFHSARMDEVLHAVQSIQKLDATRPLFVIGFSLGGNFALRVGLQGPSLGIQPALSIGISPAINPGDTLAAIDQGPLMFRWYFLNKWRKTLRNKKAAWPEYDFTHFNEVKTFVEMTRVFVERYTEYGELEKYLHQYTLSPQMLMDSPSPLAIITSRDDSVIPFSYFQGIKAQGSVQAFLPTDFGGHCGFIDDWGLNSWAERQVLRLLDNAAKN